MAAASLIRCLLACAFFALSLPTFAATVYVKVSAPGWGVNVSGTWSFLTSTSADTCAAYVSANGHSGPSVDQITGYPSAPGGGRCLYGNGNYVQGNISYGCPTGGSFISGIGGCYNAASSCPSGYTADSSGVCQPPSCTSAAPTLGDSSTKWYWTGSGSTVCQSGCLYIPDTSGYDSGSGASIGWGQLHSLGSPCDTSSTPSAGTTPTVPSLPTSCAKGTCPGTVNGASVCVACSSTTSNDKTSTTTSSTSTDASGASSSSSGSSSGTSQTTCDGSNCTTTRTTTTTAPDGSSTTTTDSSSMPQSDFCTARPLDVSCKPAESSWGGTCGAFTCSGDAVQCAQAQAAYETSCALTKTGDLQAQGESDATGAARPSGHPGLTPSVVSLGSGTFDTSNPYSDACPAALTFTVAGKSISADYCRAWPFVQALGKAAVAICLVVAARLVIGGI